MEVWGNNGPVIPLNALSRTRATLIKPTSLQPWPEGLGILLKLDRTGDSPSQLLDFNEEFLANVSYQPALIMSLPFCALWFIFDTYFSLETKIANHPELFTSCSSVRETLDFK